MIEIRKAKNNEMATVIRIANESFRPERESEFDFQKIMPKVYGEVKDTAPYHTFLLKEGEPVALTGNLPSYFSVKGTRYPYGIVGTVCTLPAHRNNGYFYTLMQALDVEDRKEGRVFSLLSGLRKRYNTFGYEKCSTTYRFKISGRSLKNTVVPEDLTVTELTEQEREASYALYLKTQPFPVREEKDFVPCLKMSDAEIYAVKRQGSVVGYFNYAARKKGIFELGVEELSLLPAILLLFMQEKALTEVTVCINSLAFNLIESLSSFAEERTLVDDIHIKVYDVLPFLQMLWEINRKNIPFSAKEECVCIDGKTYSFSHAEGVKEVSACGAPAFTRAQFLRMAIGDGNNELCRGSQFFPLFFGLNEADMF